MRVIHGSPGAYNFSCKQTVRMLYFPKCLESVAEVLKMDGGEVMEETNGGSNSM